MKRPFFVIRQASRLLDAGVISSEQLSGFCHNLAMAGENVWGLNAYLSLVSRDDLLDSARESDRRRNCGKAKGILDGIPISLKSNLAERHHPLTAGSRILGMGDPSTPPCGYDADVVRILLGDSGALLVGMTSMDEFGMGSLGTHSHHPDGTPRPTKNPLPLLRRLELMQDPTLSPDEHLASMIELPMDAILEAHGKAIEEETKTMLYSAGGSSCGSAASVAHGSAMLSLGTDTGGSIRLPASWCGLVGLKPSYGLLSRHGVVSYASSFDTVGILAQSTDCVTIALEALAQRDDRPSRDSTASFYESSYGLTEAVEFAASSLDNVRVGIPSAFVLDECSAQVREAWSNAADTLESAGAEIVQISTDDVSQDLVENSLAAYYVLVSAEASSNLSRYDGFRYGRRASEKTVEELQSDPDFSGLTPLEFQFAVARREGFGTEVARRILCGTSVLSSDRFHTQFEGAAKLRFALAQQLQSILLDKADVLLLPTALTLPCRIDNDVDNTEMFANDLMTVAPSLSGLPAVSVPVPLAGEDVFMGGLQLVGPRMREDLVLRASKVLEEACS